MIIKKEIKAGIGYSVGNVLIKGITFFSIPLFTRLLSTEDFGIYNTYMAYEAVIAIIVCLGTEGTLKNGFSDFRANFEDYLYTITLLTLLPILFIVLVFLAFKQVINNIIALPFPILIILTFHSFGEGMLRINNVKLSLSYNYNTYLKYALFNTLFSVSLSVILIMTIFEDNRFIGRILGSALAMILLGFTIFMQNSFLTEGKFKINIVKYALNLGLPLSLHYLAQIILNQMDRVMISSICGQSYTGVYSFIYSLATILQVIFNSFDNVWSVWAFRQLENKKYHVLRNVSKKYILLMNLLAISMVTFGNELIMIMAPKEYWDGIPLLMPLTLGIYVLFLYTIPAGIEYYYKKNKYIAIITVVAATINCIGNYIFINIYGYQAAAYTTFICYLVMFLGHWTIAYLILKKEGIPNIYPIKFFWRAIIFMIIFCQIIYTLTPYPVIKYILYFSITLSILFKERETIKSFNKERKRNG